MAITYAQLEAIRLIAACFGIGAAIGLLRGIVVELRRDDDLKTTRQTLREFGPEVRVAYRRLQRQRLYRRLTLRRP